MSDTENVSAEVRELIELVLKEPVDIGTNVALPAESNTVPNATDKSIQSMDTESEIPAVNSKGENQAVGDPVIGTDNRQTHSISAPETDLRVIESNALRLIAQYGSDSDSEEEELSDDDGSASSEDVVAIDNVEGVLQKTITNGNYRVISSDSEERYARKTQCCW